jgi:hypothetical protein
MVEDSVGKIADPVDAILCFSFSNEEKLLGFADLVSIADISSRATRAECPIRHLASQKTEF